MIRRHILFSVTVISLFVILSLFAHTNAARKHYQLPVNSNAEVTDKEERRIALVMGNNKYSTSPLENPRNDAEDMKTALEEFEFHVELCLDADLKTMEKAIDRFIEKLQPNAVALFYYAGHGMQIGGENYLIPTDFAARDEPTATRTSYPVSLLIKRMAYVNKRLNIIILDACRNNPYRSWDRNSKSMRGLAPVYVGTGTFIAYATGPDQLASDNKSGRNGLFTKCLLQSLRESPTCLNDVFDRTREYVSKQPGGKSEEKQVPWASTSVIGKFCFKYPQPRPPEDKEVPQPSIPPCKAQVAPDSASFDIYGTYEASGIMGDIEDVKIRKLNDSYQFRYEPTGKGLHESDQKYINGELNLAPAKFGGVLYLNPANNFGNSCGGVDLSMFRRVTWQASSTGKEENVWVEFIIGGVDWMWNENTKTRVQSPYPDSMRTKNLGTYKLTPKPQTFSVDLSNLSPALSSVDFTRIVNGFSWIIRWETNGVRLNDEGTGPATSRIFEIEISNVRYERKAQ